MSHSQKTKVPSIRFILTGAALIGLQWMLCPTSDAATFSVEVGSADTVGGFPPADDILFPGPGPALFGGTGLEVNGFTYGRSGTFSITTIDFSVDAFSAGVPGSASFAEAISGPGEQNYDVFSSGLMGTNILKHDGNGVGAAGVAAPLGMFEPQIVSPPGTGVDGYDDRAIPGPGIYWTWDSTAVPIGPSATGADILLSPTGGPPYIPVGVPYALAAGLGLGAMDNIDALEVWDTGAMPGVFDPGDFVLFSLDPTSPSLGVYGATPADILLATTGGTGVFIPEGALGLVPGDNVTALSVIPEPSAAMLFMLGVMGMALRRRLR